MSKHADPDVMQQLITGHYIDPFSVLGMHEINSEIYVRAWLPDATDVWVIETQTQRKLAQLACEDERGFFSGIIPRRRNPFRYQLQVTWNDEQQIIEDPYRFGLLTQELDGWLLAEGTHLRPYEFMGSHQKIIDSVAGVSFAVWAPNAKRVSVVGEFNFWDGRRHPMRLRQETGVWELFLPDVKVGQLYKYEIISSNDQCLLKADPYAFEAQMRPDNASRVTALPEFVKGSKTRQKANQLDQPISIYEVHLGSWRRHPETHEWLTYRELATELIPYVKQMGFTHIEFMPVSEYPFDGSWGYQPLGLYAVTSRFGTPDDFKALVVAAHDAGINVILDWVPGHFPADQYGLACFDGTALFEYADPREGFQQDWNTLIYNYGRYEVRNFLAGNSLFWLERYGIDALRVDAVSSMIYRDYSRKEGEWIPNEQGGRENIEAISFLRYSNKTIGIERPEAVTFAEESTEYLGVTLPPEMSGLGFHYKWNLGWMNDTLQYMALDPIHRKHHHDLMTFGMLYSYTENFVLPLSHDEVVHGKRSMLDKMPGDAWQKFATLRAYYGFMWGHPGKKLLFMGNEFAQGQEWDFDRSLDWYLLNEPEGWHRGVRDLVRDLNHCYREQSALYAKDYKPGGFEWLVVDDHDNSVFAFARYDGEDNEIIVVSNFTPVPREDYRIGLHREGHYKEVLNTDSTLYHGSNMGNLGGVSSEAVPSHNRDHSLCLTLPPLSTIYLQRESQ